MKEKSLAFTLAEVLITLGIIGVVAAMTMPTLVAKYQKKVVATKLSKFYSIMNQAIRLEEANNNPVSEWYEVGVEDGKNPGGAWVEEHLNPKLQIIKKEHVPDVASSNYYRYALKDGSAFIPFHRHIIFCTAPKYCSATNRFDGQTSFLFSICKDGKFVTGLCGYRDRSRDELLNLCKYGNFDFSDTSTPNKRHHCSALIQYDGWEIKDDYPWEQVILEKK